MFCDYLEIDDSGGNCIFNENGVCIRDKSQCKYIDPGGYFGLAYTNTALVNKISHKRGSSIFEPIEFYFLFME